MDGYKVTLSNFFNSIISFGNLLYIYECIKKNYKNKSTLLKFRLFLNTNLIKIYNLLYSNNYNFNKYNIFLIKEPKYRLIMSEGLPDKIVNQLFSRFILIPVLSSSLIDTNVATREGMGSEKAYNAVTKYFNTLLYKKQEIYALKIDISKYFYNIDHKRLLEKISKKLDDEYSVNFCKKILDTTNESYINDTIDSIINEEKERVSKLNISEKEKELKYKQLDKLPRYKTGKGLPIGNLSSQILAIFYLNDIDHYIKEKLHCKYYVRYMDDLLILSTDKEYLKECFTLISNKINEELLTVNNKSNIFRCSKGLEFLGYKFKVRNNKLEILYRKDTLKRIKKNLDSLLKYDKDKFYRSKGSYKGYFINCNTSIKDKLKYINEMPKETHYEYKKEYNEAILIYDNKFYYTLFYKDANDVYKLIYKESDEYINELPFRRKDLKKVLKLLETNNLSYKIIK